MSIENWRTLLRTLVAVAVLVSLYGATLRFITERNNRAVELAVDLVEVQKLAVAEGQSIRAVLTALKQAGATAVAISEDTIGSLEESRRLEIVSTPNRGTTYMLVHQGNYARVVAALKHRTNLSGMLSTPAGLEDNERPMDAGVDIHYPYNLLHGIGVGLDPEQVEQVQACGLNVIGRIENNDNTSEAGIDWTLAQLKEQKVSTIIFAGDEILGYASRLKTTAEALRRYKLNFGIVEFGKFKGDSQLHQLVPDRTIRVHTIPSAEMATATPAENTQRFSLAARERNIRLLYVRLFLSKANPLEENTRYLQKLTQALARGGLTVRTESPSHPYGPLEVPLWGKLTIGLGTSAGLLLLLDALCGFLSIPKSTLRLAGFTVAAGLALLPVVPLGGSLPLRLTALAAACLFPSLALLEPTLLQPLPWGQKLWPSLMQRLASVFLLTGVGLCFVVGLLADRAFLVKADAFMGIKLALYLPLLIATLVWVFGLRAQSPAALGEKLRELLARALPLLQDPLRLWQLLAGVGILGILGLLWLRSGNDGSAVVSGVELKFRDLLDKYLFVRPRFKSNLFAAFLLGIYFALRGNQKLALPFFLLGVIAVTDFLNTFCHLHTPLLVSAVRDLLGPLIGLGIGALAIVFLERRRLPSTEETP